jgi:hypothetical protein
MPSRGLCDRIAPPLVLRLSNPRTAEIFTAFSATSLLPPSRPPQVGSGHLRSFTSHPENASGWSITKAAVWPEQPLIRPADTKSSVITSGCHTFNEHRGYANSGQGRNRAARSCVGKDELSMFAVASFFFGRQPQQYLVSNLVARRITFGNRYKFAVPHDADVFALSGAVHCDLQGSCANQIVTGCDHFT